MDTPTTPKIPDEQFYAGIRRQLAALAHRVGSADTLALAEMVQLRKEFDQHMEGAIGQLLNDPDYPASWTDIGEAMGMTRSAARRKFGHLGGLRKAGAQPVNWR